MPLLARPCLRADEVPHVVGEDAVLDEHVALRRRAFVVDRVRAPLARVRAVVDQRDERRRDQVADATSEHRRVLVDQVGLEAVTARLVEQHATRAALEHDGQSPARGRTCSEHHQRALGSDARHLFGVDLVEQVEPEGPPRRLGARLHAGVADRHATHPEPGADAVVLDQQAVRIRDQDPPPGVGVGGAHLADGVAHRAGGVVGPLQHLGLADLGHRLRQLAHLVGRRHAPAFEGGHVGGALGAPSGGGSGLGGRLQAGVAQIGGVGEPGGVAAHDPDPGAALAAGHELLDLGVVETRRCAATILGEHLGEIAAVAQRGLQGALEYGFLDQVASYGGCLS